MFAALIGHWADGTLDLSGTTLESYADFVARVERGVAEVLDGTSKTDRIAVVTSGGPIGIAVGHVLGLPPRERIRLCWRIANASLTRIERHPSDGSLMLAGMNSVSHLLPDERTWV